MAGAGPGHTVLCNVPCSGPCGKHFVPSKLRKCSRCKAVFYCGKECQTAHWKAEHKHNCAGMLKARKAKSGLTSEQRNVRGTAYQAKGKYAKAIAEFKAAIQLDPSSGVLLANLGSVLRESGDLAGALAAQKKALKVSPGQSREMRATLQLQMSNTLADLHSFAAAEKAARKAAKLNPSNWQAHERLGFILRSRGALAASLASFRRSLELNPAVPETHWSMGLTYLEVPDLDAAIACYHRALEIDPQHTDSLINLANALDNKGDKAGAVEAYRQALRLEPKNARAHFNLAVSLCSVGDAAAARLSLVAALEADPAYEAAKTALANVDAALAGVSSAARSASTRT